VNVLPPTRLGRLRLAALAVLPVLAATGFLARTTWMPGASFTGTAGPLPDPLRDLPERLERHVRALATEVGPRNEDAPGLAAAEAYVRETLAVSGYAPERLSYPGRHTKVANVRAEHRGEGHPDEIVVVGAHYDAVVGTPGADDNASGVAAVLELARLFADRATDRTIRFLLWANEEPPSFQRDTMGSLVDAKASRARGDRIRVAYSLESIGFYSDAPDSQHYPRPFDLLYPSTGNFVAFVGSFADPAPVRRAIGAFRRVARIPSEGAAPPDVVPGAGWSDHWAYAQVGYPGVMVTDTAVFRNPEYHEAGDRPENLDYERMARVVEGMVAVIAGEAG
jgi:hypothetical protein